jgi:translation initiation factor 6 (eIF-6)
MLGCIQPMSSPMMNTMFGFAGVCAAAGVLAGPDSDINIDALSSVAQERLRKPHVLRGGVAIKGGLVANTVLNIASLSLL